VEHGTARDTRIHSNVTHSTNSGGATRALAMQPRQAAARGRYNGHAGSSHVALSRNGRQPPAESHPGGSRVVSARAVGSQRRPTIHAGGSHVARSQWQTSEPHSGGHTIRAAARAVANGRHRAMKGGSHVSHAAPRAAANGRNSGQRRRQPCSRWQPMADVRATQWRPHSTRRYTSGSQRRPATSHAGGSHVAHSHGRRQSHTVAATRYAPLHERQPTADTEP